MPAEMDMRRVDSAEGLAALREAAIQAVDKSHQVVRVCLGPGCLARGADKVAAALVKAVEDRGLDAAVRPLIKQTGCHGFCAVGPLLQIDPSGLFYARVKPYDVDEIVEATLVGGQTIDRLLHRENGVSYRTAAAMPFYQAQHKIALRNVGVIDPLSFDDALVAGAYQALAKVLTTMTPDQVVEQIDISGLRGRGGGGFPTGRKWRSAVAAARKRGGPVYVVVNGDEGDPGAFMDRAIMEGDPHSVLEGLIIGAYAVGANTGFMYVRAEYPIAVKHLNLALEQARAVGLLGENILGSGFDFDVSINTGAGAFVCGESTALFTSIEGRAGEPRPKYVHSVEEGLWGRPTVLNNVETWANVPQIIDRGGEWYAGIGTPSSTGTKVFSLVGKVNNVGLVEVPMGVTLADIVEKIGGGIKGGGRFKAVQTGGPSGGCIPYELKDLSVDYDTLVKAGSMMGSGGMIVMDDHDCVVDLARYFLEFLKEESCGKCLPCNLGLDGMLEFLDRFSRGEGAEQDIDDLASLGRGIIDASLCALGGSAPNPVLTTIKYFRDEYLAHIRDHKCPAGVCRDLITFRIDPDKCTGCGLCLRQCPQGGISGEKKQPHVIDESACIRCGVCRDVCKTDAVVVV
jgi:NADH:ubiquinone oxidoreductase subunit F (NADH-binding)/(2Fe-2S) ferredoxin/NAD-dependent dihydropyrimidine dehydrogenase PreA subunit